MDVQTQKQSEQAVHRCFGKLRLQAAALIAVLGGPFALYAALTAGHVTLAVACFVLIVLAMIVTMVVS